MDAIDINADFGESFGNWRMGDESIIDYLTTISLACGFHAGDPVTMLRCTRLAASRGVAVGAHPGLPDLVGFGRRVMNISLEDAYSYTAYQIGALSAFLCAESLTVNHVKPHGAFYSMVQSDSAIAKAVIDAMSAVAPDAMLFWPAPTETAPLALEARRVGIRVVGEIYPDMTYDDRGQLILERAKAPVEPREAVAIVDRYLSEGCVRSVEGKSVPVSAESICVHGDTPNAKAVLIAIREFLDEQHIAVRAINQPDRALALSAKGGGGGSQ